MPGALSESRRAMIALAGAIAEGNLASITARAAEAIAAGLPTVAIDELVLQSVLTVGWPRALVAAGACRSVIGTPPVGGDDDLDYDRHAEWTARGEATCRIIYGDHY